MSQYPLRLVTNDSAPVTPSAAPRSRGASPDVDPRALDDRELLAHYVPDADRLCAIAGGMRRALELPFDRLAEHGVTARQYRSLRLALELGRRYVSRYFSRGQVLTSPADTRQALLARMRDLEHELFACLFLTNRHQILGYEELFRGTIDGTTVHIREVVKRALHYNAAAVVLAHNHPSGVAEPSRSDRAITQRLIAGLALVDVRVLDHFVIGDGDVVSFSERGWV